MKPSRTSKVDLTHNKEWRHHVVARTLRANIPAGVTKVLAAVSGGADSVALLAALKTVRDIDIEVAHCNFHLRGEESDRDQRSVEILCRNLNLTLHTIHFDVGEYLSVNKGCSVEMACRNLRYEWFHSLADKINADRISTGHNSDDNVETMLLNLFRGCGTAGLKGMVTDNGQIWRPLLDVNRKEILEFLKVTGLSYIVDSSNLSSDYRRNFIRNELLPMLRTQWEGIDNALLRTLHNVRNENKVVEQALSRILPADCDTFDTKTIMSFGDPELAVRRFIAPLRPFTTTADEIIRAIKAAKSDVRRWKLPLGIVELRGKRLRRIEHSDVQEC